MSAEPETVKEYERDGWTVRVSMVEDYDYRPGYDDDCYPRLTYVERFSELPDERDEEGRFLPQPLGPFPGVVQGEYYVVEPDEVDRLAAIWETPIRRARKGIEEDAKGLANRSLFHVNVDVDVSRAGHILGRASLGGVTYDTRTAEAEAESRRYVEAIPDEYDLVGEAIDEAEEARKAIA